MNFLHTLRDLFRPPQPPASEAVQAMRSHKVYCIGPHGLHRMAYTEWGDPHNPKVLLCVHGLTRNGRDFDMLAQALSDEYRVICPDIAGRGHSDWLTCKEDYILPVYVADIITLIARLNVETVHWVGTSMGGLIGMMIASQPLSPISRLVLNDVGPKITVAALRRIGKYVGDTPRFTSHQEAETYLREICAPFGPLTDAQWKHITTHSTRIEPDGALTMAYDPGIGETFRHTPVLMDIDMWTIYDQITCPTLVLRGGNSDLLEYSTLKAMEQRGPHARTIQFPGVGHAPMLMARDQINAIRTFLLDA